MPLWLRVAVSNPVETAKKDNLMRYRHIRVTIEIDREIVLHNLEVQIGKLFPRLAEPPKEKP